MSKVLRRGSPPYIQNNFHLFWLLNLLLTLVKKLFCFLHYSLITFHEAIKFYEYNTFGKAEKAIHILMIFVWILMGNQTVLGNKL